MIIKRKDKITFQTAPLCVGAVSATVLYSVVDMERGHEGRGEGVEQEAGDSMQCQPKVKQHSIPTDHRSIYHV